jgi:SLIT-ROBO Rho GTPase activating protein
VRSFLLKPLTISLFQIEKEFQKRKQKYEDARMKATKARNEYMLCMDSANASIQKYFVDDLSDLIDVRSLC